MIDSIEFPHCGILLRVNLEDAHTWEELTIRWFLITLEKRIRTAPFGFIDVLMPWSEICQKMIIYCYEYVDEESARYDWQSAFDRFKVQRKINRIVKAYKRFEGERRCAG